MATCFLNNAYCCYLPAHSSHGLQPLDNGVFNASKAAGKKRKSIPNPKNKFMTLAEALVAGESIPELT
ncbi:putative transcriptional regulatory protein C3C7.04 [Fusarium oxysporum f. sp. albedinis]|nr:putative transcriptional regulatory protein C3C7.04 [Fusarium oxysporum f. sp. albedinis]